MGEKEDLEGVGEVEVVGVVEEVAWAVLVVGKVGFEHNLLWGPGD